MSAALRALRRAAALLRRERSLWPWAALPLALNALAFGLAVAVFVAHLDALAAPFERWLAVSPPAHWFGYVWTVPLWGLAWLVRALLLAALALALYASFTLIGGVVAAPFLDALSARVERIAGGPALPAESGIGAALRHAGRCIRDEAKRVAFFVGGQAVLLSLGFVPGLAPFAGAGALLFSALFLPLDYTGFALDRREVPFAARRRWILAHKVEMLAFGSFALALYALPGLSFLCLPWLVTAGTLLALELGPPARLR
ncbi:MAG TPA: EI24 domain-containing protein [Myxococcota bacterium]|nr:EI24 domain-containing protein [Myxococcota bacterium]